MSAMEDEDEEETIGSSKYPVMPSLVALQQMKNRLHLAHLGKKLMKWTALATGRDLRKLAEDILISYDRFKDDVRDAFMLLARARYFYPNLNRMVIENFPTTASVYVKTTSKSSSGVKVMQLEIIESDNPAYPFLGIDKGGHAITRAKEAWLDLLRRMIAILANRISFADVEMAHKNATKKSNVLDKVVIPRIVLTIRYILSELEEKEREETFRLKRFKQLKYKHAATANPKKKEEEKEICTPYPVVVKQPAVVAVPVVPQTEPETKEFEEEVTDIEATVCPEPRKEIPSRIPATKPIPPKVPFLDICCSCLSEYEADPNTPEPTCPICKKAVKALEQNTGSILSLKPYPSTDYKKRLEDLTTHIDEVISLTKRYRMEGIVSPSMEKFIQTCNSAKEKIEDYAHKPQKCDCRMDLPKLPTRLASTKISFIQSQPQSQPQSTSESFRQVPAPESITKPEPKSLPLSATGSCGSVCSHASERPPEVPPPVPPPSESAERLPPDQLGYFESKFKEIIRVKRLLNEDGTVTEERQTITVKTEKKNPKTPEDVGSNFGQESYIGSCTCHSNILHNKKTAQKIDIDEICAPEERVGHRGDDVKMPRKSSKTLRDTKSEHLPPSADMAEPKLRACVSANIEDTNSYEARCPVKISSKSLKLAVCDFIKDVTNITESPVTLPLPTLCATCKLNETPCPTCRLKETPCPTSRFKENSCASCRLKETFSQEPCPTCGLLEMSPPSMPCSTFFENKQSLETLCPSCRLKAKRCASCGLHEMPCASCRHRETSSQGPRSTFSFKETTCPSCRLKVTPSQMPCATCRLKETPCTSSTSCRLKGAPSQTLCATCRLKATTFSSCRFKETPSFERLCPVCMLKEKAHPSMPCTTSRLKETPSHTHCAICSHKETFPSLMPCTTRHKEPPVLEMICPSCKLKKTPCPSCRLNIRPSSQTPCTICGHDQLKETPCASCSKHTPYKLQKESDEDKSQKNVYRMQSHCNFVSYFVNCPEICEDLITSTTDTLKKNVTIEKLTHRIPSRCDVISDFSNCPEACRVVRTSTKDRSSYRMPSRCEVISDFSNCPEACRDVSTSTKDKSNYHMPSRCDVISDFINCPEICRDLITSIKEKSSYRMPSRCEVISDFWNCPELCKDVSTSTTDKIGCRMPSRCEVIFDFGCPETCRDVCTPTADNSGYRMPSRCEVTSDFVICSETYKDVCTSTKDKPGYRMPSRCDVISDFFSCPETCRNVCTSTLDLSKKNFTTEKLSYGMPSHCDVTSHFRICGEKCKNISTSTTDIKLQKKLSYTDCVPNDSIKKDSLLDSKTCKIKIVIKSHHKEEKDKVKDREEAINVTHDIIEALTKLIPYKSNENVSKHKREWYEIEDLCVKCLETLRHAHFSCRICGEPPEDALEIDSPCQKCLDKINELNNAMREKEQHDNEEEFTCQTCREKLQEAIRSGLCKRCIANLRSNLPCRKPSRKCLSCNICKEKLEVLAKGICSTCVDKIADIAPCILQSEATESKEIEEEANTALDSESDQEEPVVVISTKISKRINGKKLSHESIDTECSGSCPYRKDAWTVTKRCNRFDVRSVERRHTQPVTRSGTSRANRTKRSRSFHENDCNYFRRSN